ncbi:MAG: hypothetical protein U9O89_04195 [Thermoproteota archaeon]|nr:hypothetical protein [Thermoproteota archaeon]
MKNKLTITVVFVAVVVFGINCLGMLSACGSGHRTIREVSIIAHVGYTETVRNVTFYVVEGVIQNNCTVNLRSINVTATLYDVSNCIIYEPNTRITLDVLKPNNKVPFEISFALGSLSSPEHYRVRACGVETDKEPSTTLEIIIQRSDEVDGEGYRRIVGKVRNKGGVKAVSVKVTCAFYGSDERLIGMRHNFTSPLSISPGGEADFEVGSKPFRVESANFESFAVARRYERVPWENWVLLAAMIVACVLFVVYMKRRGW